MNVCISDDVYARCSDGITYIGTVTQVDTIRKEVEVKFEDGDLFWTRFSDLRLAKKKTSSAQRCRGCFAHDDTALVVCNQCNEAFHPKCHIPKIDDEDKIDWFCRFCIQSKFCSNQKNTVRPTLMQKIRKTYPYDLKKLKWDSSGKTNTDERYCYCGGPGDWNLKMLQCDSCYQWFHEACIFSIETPILNGDCFYLFICSICNNGNETLKRLHMTWSEALHLILYNLGLISPARFHRLETDIVRYAKSIWNELRVDDLEMDAPDWDTKRLKIIDVLQSNRKRFQQYEKNGSRLKLWGLINPDQPPQPHYKVKKLQRYSKLTSFSLSDDVGHIKLKITRSPSESQKRCSIPYDKIEDDCFLSNSSPSPLANLQKSKLRKNSKFDDNSSSCQPSGSSSSTPSYKPSKRKLSEKQKCFPTSAKKRQNSVGSSSSDMVVKSKGLNTCTVPPVSRKMPMNQHLSFCLSQLVPQRDFFDTHWRMTSGEGFRVLGNRVSPDGKISYLIEWEGCNDIF